MADDIYGAFDLFERKMDDAINGFNILNKQSPSKVRAFPLVLKWTIPSHAFRMIKLELLLSRVPSVVYLVPVPVVSSSPYSKVIIYSFSYTIQADRACGSSSQGQTDSAF